MKPSWLKRQCKVGTPYVGLCQVEKNPEILHPIKSIRPCLTWRCKDCPKFFNSRPMSNTEINEALKAGTLQTEKQKECP